jgi:phosphopantetheinyl transferase
MPIVKIKHINDNVTFGMWKIEEKEDYLQQHVYLSKQERAEYKKIQHVKRKKEWLSARAVLLEVCKSLKIKYKGTVKDENNKPHLKGLPWHISISHSFPYAIALINKKEPCGVDIEKAKPALFHVSKRFLSDRELHEIPRNPGNLCAAWAAKEVLFKIYGRQKVSFKENLLLSPFDLKPAGNIIGHIKLDMGTRDYILEYFRLEDFVVIYSTV